MRTVNLNDNCREQIVWHKKTPINHLNQQALLKIVDRLFTSEIRNGLQLYLNLDDYQVHWFSSVKY